MESQFPAAEPPCRTDAAGHGGPNSPECGTLRAPVTSTGLPAPIAGAIATSTAAGTPKARHGPAATATGPLLAAVRRRTSPA